MSLPYQPRLSSLATHHPLLYCWHWGPVDTVAHLPCLTLRGPLSESSFSSVAVSPALPAEKTQERSAKAEQYFNHIVHFPSRTLVKEDDKIIFYRTHAINNK